MARYKHTDVEDGQGIFLTINLKNQLLPGTFEYMLNDLMGNKIDLSIFDGNYKNDKTGAKAIPPVALMKLIIYGYSKGKNSSRGLGKLAQDNIIAKALTGGLEPHWTTIADFISINSEKFQETFVKVLAYCVELGLVGGETFAVDGLRLPSNASIEMSGTKEELKKRVEVYRRMAEKHLRKHQKNDEGGMDEEEERHYKERQKHLNWQIEKVGSFLDGMEEKEGKHAKEIKSNVTDNESAMIHSSKGYIQGYVGLAATDKNNQIIVHAKAEGSANEGDHLPFIVDKTLENMEKALVKNPEGTKPTFMADANYFSEDNLRALKERGVEAIIPDYQYKKRLGDNYEMRYEACDFTYHEEENYYECPYGKKLEYKGKAELRGLEWKIYQACFRDCLACPLNTRCIRTKKEISKLNRGRKLMISKTNEAGNLCVEMIKKLNTEEYQNRYAYRIQIIEPVFSSISYCKRLNRFTLRGKNKVNGQWNLYGMVHNLSKCLNGYNREKEYA